MPEIAIEEQTLLALLKLLEAAGKLADQIEETGTIYRDRGAFVEAVAKARHFARGLSSDG